jgi:nitrilase
MDKESTAEKIVDIVMEAGKEGVDLVVFPETFIPMFPTFEIDLDKPVEWCGAVREFTEQSVYIDGDEIRRIADAARGSKTHVVLGISEREGDANIYNTQVFIGSDGCILGRRRKLFPSNREKVFWSAGDGKDILVVDSPIGRIGGLICYEHLQPLLKYACMSLGEQIHCASWPGWPHLEGVRSNKHVIDASARAYALEGQCFVIISSLYIPPDAVPEEGSGNSSWAFFGGSGIVGPGGEYIAGPLYDAEGIVYGEIDLANILLRKSLIDITGRDQKKAVFNFSWNDRG